MYVAMPTMSERAFTDICLLRQVPAPHPPACWRHRSTVALPTRSPTHEDAMCVALDRLDRVQIPSLAQQQPVKYGPLKRPDSHRCQVQHDKSNVARDQHQSSIVSHAQSRKEIRAQNPHESGKSKQPKLVQIRDECIVRISGESPHPRIWPKANKDVDYIPVQKCPDVLAP